MEGSFHLQRIERWWLSNRQGGVQFWMDFFSDLELAGLFASDDVVQK